MKSRLALICLLVTVAGCGQARPHAQRNQSLEDTIADAQWMILGPEFRQALDEYAGKKGQARGLAIISQHDNLVLVSIDFGDRTERALGSKYVGDGNTYWKVEELNKSNRDMLSLLRRSNDDGGPIDDGSDFRADQTP